MLWALEKKTQFWTNELYFSLVSLNFVYNFTFSFFINLQDLIVHAPVPWFKIGGWDPTKLAIKINKPPTYKYKYNMTVLQWLVKRSSPYQTRPWTAKRKVMRTKMNEWSLISDWTDKAFNSRISGCRIIQDFLKLSIMSRARNQPDRPVWSLTYALTIRWPHHHQDH